MVESDVHEDLTWSQRFIADLKSRQLLYVKVLFFLQSASLVTIYSYLAIHMRSMNFSVEDAGLCNLLLPIIEIFAPPLAGALADKIGNFRLFLSCVTFLNGIPPLFFILAPNVEMEQEVVTSFCCSYDNINDYLNCDQSNQTLEDMDMISLNCTGQQNLTSCDKITCNVMQSSPSNFETVRKQCRELA